MRKIMAGLAVVASIGAAAALHAGSYTGYYCEAPTMDGWMVCYPIKRGKTIE